MISVVVLSKFIDIFEGFRESVDRDAPLLQKILVKDGDAVAMDEPWTAVSPFLPFQIARNANIGWRMPNTDIVYAGDDTRIIEPNTIARLESLANSDPAIGILAPRIKPAIPTDIPQEPLTFKSHVPFVFVYIKRAVIDKIGYLDERFQGYGVEDIDYCYRARRAGFKIAVANHITIQHGTDQQPAMTTFMRLRTSQQLFKEDRENWRRFAEKWGIPNNQTEIWKMIEGPLTPEEKGSA